MPAKVTLGLSGDQHAHLRNFLFPPDGKEAIAILLCGQRDGDRRYRLSVREIHEIPYEYCTKRTTQMVTWSPDYVDDILERAATEKLSVVKIHSHPNGYAKFSETDDESDDRILPMIRGWVEADLPHGSVVMLPGGQMFGRVLRDGAVEQIECISVAGDELHFWYADAEGYEAPSFVASHAQAFDEGTIERLQRLSIGVVGASGTGSPTIEQLVRLGAGEVVMVDDDTTEDRNINRILNSTIQDAKEGRAKVDVIADSVMRMGLGTKVVSINKNLWDPDVVRAIAQCDVLFGCVDSIDGRYLLNAISTFYNIPYFDLGIRLIADPKGENRGRVREVCGTVNYIRPGRSSLMSRGLFTMQGVAAAGLARNDPTAHQRQVKDGYIKGVQGSRPAVISVNMLGSALAVNEFLARLHPYREDANCTHAAVTFSLASMELISDSEEGICSILSSWVGAGDMKPLLREMGLAERRKA
ncbi:ThiF family adenylyltransferase [Pyruvatibacter mobilis]|uniref:ThiF family adenylyltransferase n=1 Tax=Pyruvatibacter mobilis TaxID=1712261 RepID=UPI003C79D525